MRDLNATRYAGLVASVLERITVDPEQFGGRPCVRGMRIRVTESLVEIADR